jgi:hypothetical protein
MADSPPMALPGTSELDVTALLLRWSEVSSWGGKEPAWARIAGNRDNDIYRFYPIMDFLSWFFAFAKLSQVNLVFARSGWSNAPLGQMRGK